MSSRMNGVKRISSVPEIVQVVDRELLLECLIRKCHKLT